MDASNCGSLENLERFDLAGQVGDPRPERLGLTGHRRKVGTLDDCQIGFVTLHDRDGNAVAHAGQHRREVLGGGWSR